MIKRLDIGIMANYFASHMAEMQDKINEIIEEVNRLGKEATPHAHIDLNRGGPTYDINQYMEPGK